MNISAEIKLIKKQLDSVTDESLIDAIKKMIYVGLRSRVSTPDDFWNELTPEQRKSAERGIKDIKAGKKSTHSNVFAKLRK